MNRKTRIISGLLLIALLCCCAVFDAFGEGAFEVKRIGNINPYADNAFRITAEEPGDLLITIHDGVCIYRTLTEHVEAGETIIHWDGCGYNQEKLYEKYYTVKAELTTDSGLVHTVSFDSPIDYAVQFLQYALPSSYNLYLDDPEGWFIEFKTVTRGKIQMEMTPSGSTGTAVSYLIDAPPGKITRKDFKTISGKKKPEPGEYNVTVYEKTRPDVQYTFSLTVSETAPEPLPVTVTGPIMADRSMTDAEIWELMMKPSVVVNIDNFKHQEVYTEPDESSKSLGTLHGQTQALEVFRIEDGWARIGAWNHEDASYVEGWVPVSKLKVESPCTEYGILIDKQKQTLTVYSEGKKLDTLLVSTGRAARGALYQETSAGSFLTGYHRVNFSMNGKKYDFVIQYDGGNLLHQTPYDWGQHKKDFTLGRGYLGAKASHACIRIQPEPGEGGLNAYWLFTHIPYHTRVMILDDEWEREAVSAKLQRSGKDDLDLSRLHTDSAADTDTGERVTITFTGTLTAGGTRSFNLRPESFASFTEKQSYGLPLSGLKELFSSDDLTCVQLGCMILTDNENPPEGKGVPYAPAGMRQLFEDTSVELAVPSGSGFSTESASISSAEALSPYTDVLKPGGNATVTMKGHLFGFAECTEKEYLADPETIDRKIAELDAAGCERIIMLFSWGKDGEENHSIVQEAMAHRAVRAGADLMVGSLPGTVQGIDFIEGVPVFYSLGDLLNGSTSAKPKNQQGLLAQVTFGFGEEDQTVSVSIIPLLPYGNAEKENNDYVPTTDLTAGEAQSSLGNLWRDSTDAALNKITVRLPEP